MAVALRGLRTQKKSRPWGPAWKESRKKSDVGLGLAKTLDAIPRLPLASFLEDFYALKTF
jgi:hypothetical protein